jgi:ferredoxin-NADP reductase/Na+-translocating ferredoxin:NAD+ oxidoreductase RnfD subunit
MLSLIDRLLNKITMYRLVLYYLIALIGIAAVFGYFGILPYSPLALGFSTAVLLAVSLITNELFARTFRAQPNVESVYITALILALIITPVLPGNAVGLSFLIWAAVLAMASKYILAIRKKHFFNPAAFAVALTAFAISQAATWWVGGNLPLMAFVLIGGFLIVRKIQRFDLVLPFLGVAIASILFTSPPQYGLFNTLSQALLHTPLFFFAAIMLTEPLTTPPTRTRRIVYGAFVGLLFAPNIHFGSIYSTPELALLVGNILSYILSPKSKHALVLKEKKEVGKYLFDFVFATDGRVRFRPGQYMEWTLAHQGSDSRGNRRYFTIASSPTENDLRLGVKFPKPPSSFKRGMLELKPGDQIIGGQLAGDFTLPRDPRKKLVFVAGGIGITPFRSMIKYLVDKNENRDIILLYSDRSTEEIVYRDVFDEAAQAIGMKTIYAITGAREDTANQVPPLAEGKLGGVIFKRIDADLIRREIPDYLERTFYISGTQAMVSGMTTLLHDFGIPRRQIKTDFFPGF